MNGSVFNFDAIARYYDAWYDAPAGKIIDLQEKNAVERVLPPARKGATLLEVGSGTGHWSAWFAEKGFRVTGIDISAEMTRIAAGKEIKGARFIQGDFLDAEFGGGFDVAAAVTSLEFIPDVGGVLDRMRASLRPGGSLVVGALNRRSWMGIMRRLKGAKDPVFHNARFFAAGEVRELLGRYGKPRVIGSTFALPYRPLLWAAPALEKLGGALCPCFGNFIVGTVTV
jgi:ubiquinone/menaquinone biosynthesis C-methylase UbiE